MLEVATVCVFIDFGIIKELPGLVGIGRPYIFRFPFCISGVGNSYVKAEKEKSICVSPMDESMSAYMSIPSGD